MKVRFTRLGLHFLFVAVFAMAGGAIRGFNLLLVLAGFLIAVLLVQWRCTRRAIESLGVARVLPDEAFAGQAFRVRYQVHNRSRWLGVWMIRVEDDIDQIGHSSTKRSLFQKDNRQQNETLVCGLGRVLPKRSEWTSCDCVVAERGRYRFSGPRLSTSFPFSLLVGTMVSGQGLDADENELVVFAKRLTLHRDWQRGLLSQAGSGAASARRSGMGEGEFYGLRPWQRGDSPRQIHWRTTARMGDLAVRQTEESRRVDVCLVIDGFLGNSAKATQQALETAVSLATTLAIRLSENQDNSVSVVSAGAIVESTRRCLAARSIHEGLELISRIESTQHCHLASAIRAGWEISGGRQNLVVLSTRTMSEASCAGRTDDESAVDHGVEHELNASLASWRRSADVKWIDVMDPAANRWFGGDRLVAKPMLDDGQTSVLESVEVDR